MTRLEIERRGNMRFKLYFTLENPKIPIQYRKNLISFFKYSLSEYDNSYFKKFYNEKDNIIKPYTFSIFFKQPKIEKDEIIIENKKFELNISIEDYETALILYNSFNKQKFKSFSIKNNSWTLEKMEILKEKQIKSENINIKFMSPLCARNRQNNKDYYYSFEHSEFEETVKINLREQLKISKIPTELIDNFKIKPINAKKVIIKFYEKQIECSTGIFNIQGDKELLTYLYKAGMGSKHSAGFGMFQII